MIIIKNIIEQYTLAITAKYKNEAKKASNYAQNKYKSFNGNN